MSESRKYIEYGKFLNKGFKDGLKETRIDDTPKKTSSRRGRPPIENPRNNHLRIRLNREEKALVDEASIITGLNTSDLLREGVKRILEDEHRHSIDI